jgi:hypothetical protein
VKCERPKREHGSNSQFSASSFGVAQTTSLRYATGLIRFAAFGLLRPDFS